MERLGARPCLRALSCPGDLRAFTEQYQLVGNGALLLGRMTRRALLLMAPRARASVGFLEIRVGGVFDG